MQESILVFGGGILQVSIINRAKALGFYTIVIDPDPKALGRSVADAFFTVPGDDYQMTYKIASDYKVKGIVTAATDKPILMMCKIAAALNVQFPTYESCDTLIDKGKFKDLLRKYKFPHANGKVYTSTEGIDPDLFKYPLIIKPVKNSGSRGVYLCDQASKLFETIEASKLHCQDDSYIIEEFLVGDEISVEAIVYDKKVSIIQVTDKVVSNPPYNVELAHIQPSRYSNKKKDIQILLQRLIDISGLDNTIIHPELIINQDNIYIIELGPRLGGDYITSKLVPLSTGINLEEIQLRIATNMQFEQEFSNKASLISFLNFTPGSYFEINVSEEELRQDFPEVIEFEHTLKNKTKVHQITNSLDRYGHYILQGNDPNSLNQISQRITKFIIEKSIQK